MRNNGAPGNGMIRCYWVKKLTAIDNALMIEFKKVYEQEEMLPPWLVTGRTILLPKNTRNMQKNYRPIACQNIIYNTGILTRLWSITVSPMTLSQPNKLVVNLEAGDVRMNCCIKKYKKAFDSVPHDCILKSLKLAHVPQKIINTIENLMKVWSTKLYLKETETDIINYLTGFLQGDWVHPYRTRKEGIPRW